MYRINREDVGAAVMIKMNIPNEILDIVQENLPLMSHLQILKYFDYNLYIDNIYPKAKISKAILGNFFFNSVSRSS